MIDQIKSLGDAPASEKALVLSSLTVHPIPLQDLENLLDSEQLAWRDEVTSQWSGPLVDAMSNASPVSDGLAELFRHLNKIRSVHIETDKPEWAVKCSQLLDGLIYVGLLSAEQKLKVLTLGGGRLNGDVTVEDVDVHVAADSERQARKQRGALLDQLSAEIANRFINEAYGTDEALEDLRLRIKSEL